MNIEFPVKLQFLFEPRRYKVAHGGRGGAKSWGFARALLILGRQKKLRILCVRELQKSIQDSVHKLLKDQIEAMGLGDFYDVQKTTIIGQNGTEFIFEGIRHNVNQIKSTEGIDICWVEEAQSVTKQSWDLLIPTIRKEGSEIWVSFNPDQETDDTYQRFIVHPPAEAVVVQINWRDNPWFPEVLRLEMEHCKARNEDEYLHIWEGHCRRNREGAVYAKEMRAARAEGRITRVKYQKGVGVDVFADLGRRDKTALWFVQLIAFEHRFIDYYEAAGYDWDHYLGVFQGKRYIYNTINLPHDGSYKLLAAKRTIKEQTRDAGYRVKIVPKLSIEQGINAARNMFSTSWFDQENCEQGINCLENYRYEVDPNTGLYSLTPLHDWTSHGADGYRYTAVGLKAPRKETKHEPPARRRFIDQVPGLGWLNG